VSVTALLSAACAYFAVLSWLVSAICNQGGGGARLPCLVELRGLAIGAALSVPIPVVFGVWASGATSNGQIARRLMICSSGYLLPTAWTVGVLIPS
jgi:hypothetical protein